METVSGDCHWPVPARIAPSAHRITMVLTNVAKSELTFSMPTFAKMAVSAANPAERTAQSCQESSADFIDGTCSWLCPGTGGCLPKGTPAKRYCVSARPLLTSREMGMGSPDNRREADDSCQALCVGRSMSELLHCTQLVWRLALLERVAA